MTQYALITYYQVWENYGAHNWDGKGECPQYWKAKDGHEEVDHNINTFDVDVLREKATALQPESNEYIRFDLVDWELVNVEEHYSSVVEAISEAFQQGETDLGYVRYCFGRETVFDIIVAKLEEEGRLITEGTVSYMKRIKSFK